MSIAIEVYDLSKFGSESDGDDLAFISEAKFVPRIGDHFSWYLVHPQQAELKIGEGDLLRVSGKVGRIDVEYYNTPHFEIAVGTPAATYELAVLVKVWLDELETEWAE